MKETLSSHDPEMSVGEAARAKQYDKYCEIAAMKYTDIYGRPEGGILRNGKLNEAAKAA